ncbi:hypothetical protein [Vibrio sp. THAF190c]|nr:hypothetical protein [Vibrio sp. THAF190c]QFT13220.1 hypothetical protein FIV04_25055 [Vibrio sp. THAF190c]
MNVSGSAPVQVPQQVSTPPPQQAAPQPAPPAASHSSGGCSGHGISIYV